MSSKAEYIHGKESLFFNGNSNGKKGFSIAYDVK